jgi:hypothetical protein
MAAPSRARARHLVALADPRPGADHRSHGGAEDSKNQLRGRQWLQRGDGQWLRNNGLDGITPQERYRVILCIENLTMVEQWRAGLEEAQRRRLNHPGAILTHWRRSIKAESAAPTRQCVRGAKPHRSGMPIFWPQETRCGEPLKRFATADQTTSSR